MVQQINCMDSSSRALLRVGQFQFLSTLSNGGDDAVIEVRFETTTGN